MNPHALSASCKESRALISCFVTPLLHELTCTLVEIFLVLPIPRASFYKTYNGLSPRQPALPIGRAIRPAIKQSHGQSYNGDQTRCSILREIKARVFFQFPSKSGGVIYILSIKAYSDKT